MPCYDCKKQDNKSKQILNLTSKIEDLNKRIKDLEKQLKSSTSDKSDQIVDLKFND